MTLYRLLLVVKFAAVMAYAGGFVSAFVASGIEERRRAVHGIASPALLVVWMAGYGLTTVLHVSMLELWILGGLVLSLASLLALVYSVSRAEVSKASFCVAGGPLVLVLVLMAFRPTWEALHP